ncbi:8-oxo-dGTP diphosphatase [Seinonella peptonophila]|uniref:8-oxo-dGTP diphosphatase n=1 Tax=Seinonella peptonophila TaxID=112248 RepID=A0A1M4ZXX1_9BACL|nr:NUDIX domain-containing protein [Seinonella peptonophila]SHF22814.1 8-oxo-dGTP diphosphatase [Seinonella peptonophila]
MNNIAVAAKCALVSDNEKVLILQKTPEEMKGDASKSSYDLPGGRIKYGEEIEVALRRELEEETGVLCDDFELKTAWSVMRPDGVQLHILLYKADYNSQPIHLSSEHDGYQWVGLEDERISTMPSWITQAVTKVMK